MLLFDDESPYATEYPVRIVAAVSVQTNMYASTVPNAILQKVLRLKIKENASRLVVEGPRLQCNDRPTPPGIGALRRIKNEDK